jgi:hypothetical protein
MRARAQAGDAKGENLSTPPTFLLAPYGPTARIHTEIPQVDLSMSADVDVNVRMGERCGNHFSEADRGSIADKRRADKRRHEQSAAADQDMARISPVH